LLGSKKTVAVNACVAFIGMSPLGGETAETLIARNATVAIPDLVGSATEVAVSVTVTSFAGGVLGAV